ncbi:MAG: OmpA family protein [Myxococcota bacterium]
MPKLALLGCLLLFWVGCASIPELPPLEVAPLEPGKRERVAPDQVWLIVDVSGSIDPQTQFPEEKAALRSFVAAMPEGDYAAGLVAFGGFRRQVLPLEPFDRPALRRAAAELPFLDEGTPLHTVLSEVGESLEGQRKRAALVIWSDGLPSGPAGRQVDPQLALDRARALSEAYDGRVCIHTVQVGNDPPGGDFLRELSETSKCGSHRGLSSLDTAEALLDFERKVFLRKVRKPKPKPKPAKPAPKTSGAPNDRDGDGVSDGSDQCPETPSGAKVDRRGCWSIPWLLFETDRAELTATSEQKLRDEVLPVIQNDPELRLRIDGHTDNRGSAEHNRDLSQRRAEAVRRFLVRQGVTADRIEARGFGESKPLVPNDSPEDMARNRRTELTVLSR